MLRAAKKDKNHNEIASAFRSFGWSVWDTSQLKNSADMVVARAGITYVIEVKDGSKPPSARKLTTGEQTFRDNWRGNYAIITSLGDVQMLNSKYFTGYACQ